MEPKYKTMSIAVTSIGKTNEPASSTDGRRGRQQNSIVPSACSRRMFWLNVLDPEPGHRHHGEADHGEVEVVAAVLGQRRGVDHELAEVVHDDAGDRDFEQGAPYRSR